MPFRSPSPGAGLHLLGVLAQHRQERLLRGRPIVAFSPVFSVLGCFANACLVAGAKTIKEPAGHTCSGCTSGWDMGLPVPVIFLAVDHWPKQMPTVY